MPTETIGRYEVGNIIGRGAMAVVYRAVDPTIGRTVALKTMRFDVHGIERNEVLSRFRNEARAAGKLLHPNLVTIYDAGEQEGTFYIAMECVDGHTLQALLAEQRFLTLDRTIDVMSQICSGLDYAHAAGVVHRDIKPANIMITRSDVVKIMDFGIAKAGTQLTTGGAVLGTPNYISPEMVKGDAVDGRSDLFSAAVILHEMLLGERPFTAPNVSTIIYKIVNEPLSPDLETRVHPTMAAILRKALSKHPSDRFQRGADLVGALKDYQALLTQPIPAPVAPVPHKPLSRSPDSFGTGGAAAAVAPRFAEPVPKVQKQPLAPLYEAPEVFGSDVPEEFRNFSSAASAAPTAEPSAPRPTVAPRIDHSLPVAPLNPPAASFGLPIVSPVVAPAPMVKPKSGLPRMYVVAAIVVVVLIGGVAAVLRMKSDHPAPVAGLAVAAPDPVAIIQSEPAKAPEETSRIETAAQAQLAADQKSDALAARRKNAKLQPPPVSLAPEPVASAPVITTADLEISSVPEGATVQLDGQSRSEKTPFTVSTLQPGAHTLIFTKPGYMPMARSVDLTAASNASVAVNLVLSPTAIAFESTPPGAVIFVDEEPTGQITPATVKLSPGTHEISLAKTGFDEATGSVRLNEGDTQHFNAVLQPGNRGLRTHSLFAGSKDKAMIVVRSRPRGARITLEDSSTDAVTPARLIVHNGKARLTVEKDGYKPFHRELQVNKGDVIVVDAILEPKN
jgi:serine/threonine-protein kinase